MNSRAGVFAGGHNLWHAVVAATPLGGDVFSLPKKKHVQRPDRRKKQMIRKTKLYKSRNTDSQENFRFPGSHSKADVAVGLSEAQIKQE